MAGIALGVYDIFQPTPVPLKELSAITVSLEVWRSKVKEYRNNGKLNEFCPSGERILSKTMLPDLPSMICITIDKYVRRFWTSMESWLKEHHRRIFYFCCDHQNSVLEYFDDFVCDYTGAIDYARTAERMMHCDRFDANQKFVIACTYFFEDDIKGLWPLVSSNRDLKNIVYSKRSQLYYWICRLTNNLDKIPTLQVCKSVENAMLLQFMPHNRPSLEYFWNRLPTENRIQKTTDLFTPAPPFFFRFILPKFDDLQLNEFVNKKDCHQLVTGLFSDAWYDEERIFSMWMYVQKVINVDKFIEVVEGMLESEVVGPDPHDVNFEEVNDDRANHKNWGDLCREIWNSVPEDWKRKAVVKITSDTEFELHGGSGSSPNIPPLPKHFDFMSTFLSCATSVERRRFWNNCWADLVIHLCCEDLSKIINLCFENKDTIDKIKQNTMANDGNISFNCMSLMEEAFFDEVNDYVSFLFYEHQPARHFKQELLQYLFLDRDNIEFSGWVVRKGKRFVEFVDDAYGDIDQSTEFKIQFMSSPEIQNILSYFALTVASEQFIEFMDSFALAEEILLPIKTRIIGLYKEAGGAVDQSWKTILSWCLIYHEM